MTAGTTRCRLFGVNLESDLDPPVRLPVTGPVTLTIVGDPRLSFEGPTAFSIPRGGPDGGLVYQFRHTPDATFLRLDPIADFLCADDRILYRRLSELHDGALPWQLYGIVFAVWLERLGCAVFHAATVEIGARAVAFLGDPGAGKSTLTAAFMREGHRVLGDDHLVVDRASSALLARPALPWLKVGPAVARWLGLDHATLPILHPLTPKRQLDVPAAAIARESLELGPLYCLQRDPTAETVSIEEMGLDDSLRTLVRHSYAPRSVAAARLDVGRLRVLAGVLSQVRVWSLRYPDGLNRTGDVVSAVRAHAATAATTSDGSRATIGLHGSIRS